MSEEEALAQLRDIHLPADLAIATSMQFAVWPFIVLALIVGSIIAIRFWSRSRWRRRAHVELSRIVGTEDPAQQWSLLLAFAKNLPARTGRKVALPDVAFRRQETITETERTAFVDFVRAELSQ